MKLTKEESRFVEDNHNLIYGYAHLRGIDLEEHYGLLAIELCRAISGYKSHRGSFSNYYYTLCDNALIKEYYKQSRQKRDGGDILSLDYEYSSGECDSGPINAKELFGVQEPVELEEVIEYNRLLTELLNDEYGEIVQLRLEGYTQMEISRIIGMSQSKISNELSRIKEEYFSEYE